MEDRENIEPLTALENSNYLIPIANTICKANALDRSRKRNNVFARMLVISELRKSDTCINIGRIFSLDHATILYYQKKHQDLLLFDKQYKFLYNTFIKETIKPVSQEVFIKENTLDIIKNINIELSKIGFNKENTLQFWQSCIIDIENYNN